MRRSSRRSDVIAVAAVGFGAAGVAFGMAALRWRAMSLLPDEAFYIEAFFNTARGHAWFPQTVFHPYSSTLTVHLNLIYALALPVYALWPSPLTLFGIADIAIGATAAAIWRIGRRLFCSSLLGAAWVAVFLLYSSTVFLAEGGFRDTTLVMAFLAWALLFYLEDRRGPFFMMLALATACKEDVALVLVTWGIVMGLQGRGYRRGAGLAAAGLVYFVVANAVILPLLRGGHPGQIYFNGFVSPVGQTPGEIWGVVQHPAVAARLIATPQFLGFIRGLLVPFLCLALLGLEYLLIPAVFLIEIALVPAFQFVNLHYQAPAIPFFCVAAMVGTQRFAAALHRMVSASRNAAQVSLQVLVHGTVACVLVTALVFSSLPVEALTLWPSHRADSPSVGFLRSLEAVFPHASVVATNSLVSAAASRQHVVWLDHAPHSLAWMGFGMDVLALDRSDMFEGKAAFDRQVRWLLCGGAYGVLNESQHFDHLRLLLGRGADPSRNLATLTRLVEMRSYRVADLPASAAFVHLPWLYRVVHRGGINTFDPWSVAGWVRVGRPGLPRGGDVLADGPDGGAASGSDADLAGVLPGRYRVDFYLKIDRVESSAQVADLLVTAGDSSGQTLAASSRVVRGGDFRAPYVYQPFSLSVTVSGPATLRFRVRYPTRAATLWLDRIDLRSLDAAPDRRGLCGTAATELMSEPGVIRASACDLLAVSAPLGLREEGVLRFSGGGHDLAVAPNLRAPVMGGRAGVTLEAWVYPLPWPESRRLPVFWANGVDGFSLEVVPARGVLIVNAGGQAELLRTPISMGRWTRIVLSLAPDVARLDVNGRRVAQAGLAHRSSTSVYPLFVGYAPVGPARWVSGRPLIDIEDAAWFRGFMAGLRVSHGALDSGAADEQKGRPQHALLAAWKPSTATNVVVPDSSLSRNDLLLGNRCVAAAGPAQ